MSRHPIADFELLRCNDIGSQSSLLLVLINNGLTVAATMLHDDLSDNAFSIISTEDTRIMPLSLGDVC